MLHTPCFLLIALAVFLFHSFVRCLLSPAVSAPQCFCVCLVHHGPISAMLTFSFFFGTMAWKLSLQAFRILLRGYGRYCRAHAPASLHRTRTLVAICSSACASTNGRTLRSHFFSGPAVLQRQQRLARLTAVAEMWLSLALLLAFLLYWTGIGFASLLACCLCALMLASPCHDRCTVGPCHDVPLSNIGALPTSIASGITLADPLDMDYFLDVLPTQIEASLLGCIVPPCFLNICCALACASQACAYIGLRCYVIVQRNIIVNLFPLLSDVIASYTVMF